MRKPLVSIIIVNWNGGKVFDDCLKSLAKLNYPNWELVVVDNGSIDGSEKLPENYELGIKNYELIKNRENKGFAVANNQGLKKAKGDYILLLNNDTKVTSTFLSKMVEKMESDPKIGVMQPKIFLMDKPGYLDNTGTFMTWTGFLQHWGFMAKDSKRFGREREIFSAKGACLLTRKSLIEKIGLFDDDFVSYFEESDFCWRAWLAGYTVLYFPGAKIYHKLGMTSKRMLQTDINFHSSKNRILALLKNLEAKNLVIILIPHLFLNLFLIIFYLVKLQPPKAWMLTSAVLWNTRRLPQTLKKRRSVQKMRTVGDKKLFSGIWQKLSIPEMLSHFKKVEANF